MISQLDKPGRKLDLRIIDDGNLIAETLSMDILSVILAAYRDFDERMELVSDRLPAIEVVRQAVERKIGKFTKTDMMEFCPTLGKTSVESSLKQLVNEGVLIKHGKAGRPFTSGPDSKSARLALTVC